MSEIVEDRPLLLGLQLAFLFCLLALSGGAAAAAEPKVAVSVVRSGEAFLIDAVVDVPVPAGPAWDVLTDFDQMASIVGNLTSSKTSSRNGNTWIVRQEGVARIALFSFPFFSEREVRLEPMKRILAKNLSGTLKAMESETTVIPQDEGVQIRYHSRSVPESILARMFGASFVRRESEKHFAALAGEMLRRHARAEPTDKPAGSPAQ